MLSTVTKANWTPSCSSTAEQKFSSCCLLASSTTWARSLTYPVGAGRLLRSMADAQSDANSAEQRARRKDLNLIQRFAMQSKGNKRPSLTNFFGHKLVEFADL